MLRDVFFFVVGVLGCVPPYDKADDKDENTANHAHPFPHDVAAPYEEANNDHYGKYEGNPYESALAELLLDVPT